MSVTFISNNIPSEIAVTSPHAICSENALTMILNDTGVPNLEETFCTPVVIQGFAYLFPFLWVILIADSTMPYARFDLQHSFKINICLTIP